MTTRAKMPSKDDQAPVRGKLRPRPDNAVTPAGEAGWYLERERLSRKESVGTVARACALTPTHVRAIELGELAVFATRSDLYSTLTRYADYLGFEPEPLIEHFRSIEAAQSQPRLPDRDQPILRAASTDTGTPERAPDDRVARLTAAVGALIDRAGGRLQGLPTVPVLMLAVVAMLALPALAWVFFGQTGEVDPLKPPDGIVARNEQAAPAPPAAKPAEPAKPVVQLPARSPSALPTVRIREKPLGRDIVTSDEPVSREEADRLTALIARNAAGETGSVNKTGDSAVRSPADNTVSAGAVYGDKSAKVRVVLRATQGVWIRIEDGKGNVLITRTLVAGDRYRVPDQKGVVLSARNAGALQYFVDGKAVGRIGETGDIVIGFPLDARHLLRRDG